MDSQGFSRQDRLVVEGELCVEFSLDSVMGEDRVSVGGYDLHDLISSQFCDSADAVQRLGRFRLIVERLA